MEDRKILHNPACSGGKNIYRAKVQHKQSGGHLSTAHCPDQEKIHNPVSHKGKYYVCQTSPDADAFPAGRKALVKLQHPLIYILNPVTHPKNTDILCKRIISGSFTEIIHTAGIFRLLIPVTISPAVQIIAHGKADNGGDQDSRDHERIKSRKQREGNKEFHNVFQQIRQCRPDSLRGSRAAGYKHRCLIHFPAHLLILKIGNRHGQRLILNHGSDRKANLDTPKPGAG